MSQQPTKLKSLNTSHTVYVKKVSEMKDISNANCVQGYKLASKIQATPTYDIKFSFCDWFLLFKHYPQSYYNQPSPLPNNHRNKNTGFKQMLTFKGQNSCHDSVQLGKISGQTSFCQGEMSSCTLMFIPKAAYCLKLT